MNPHDTHFHCGGGSGTFQTAHLSAFHFLRNYNYLLPPDVAEVSSKRLLSATRLFSECPLESPKSEKIMPILRADSDRPFVTTGQKPLSYWQQAPVLHSDFTSPRNTLLAPCSTLFGNNHKRQRGEKRPIPEEQKDDKYFERRKRNNQAAKKSRDARKFREDQIALKAAILEHENAILRAQILTLRDEASTLRQLLMEKKVLEF